MKTPCPRKFLEVSLVVWEKILTKVKKKRSNKLHLKDLLYEFIILLKQFEPGSPRSRNVENADYPPSWYRYLQREMTFESRKNRISLVEKNIRSQLGVFLTTCHLNGISKERQPHKMPLWYDTRFVLDASNMSSLGGWFRKTLLWNFTPQPFGNDPMWQTYIYSFKKYGSVNDLEDHPSQ